MNEGYRIQISQMKYLLEYTRRGNSKFLTTLVENDLRSLVTLFIGYLLVPLASATHRRKVSDCSHSHVLISYSRASIFAMSALLGASIIRSCKLNLVL